MNEWIKTSDRVPELGKKVLVVYFGYTMLVAMRITDSYWMETSFCKHSMPYDAGIDNFLITHWMELPELPEKKNE